MPRSYVVKKYPSSFRRRRTRRLLIQRPLRTSYSLPQIMKLNLVASVQNNYQVLAGAYVQQLMPAVFLTQPDGSWPANFASMMRLYSRCQVDYVRWDLRITSVNDNDALNVAGAVVPYVDTNRAPDGQFMNQLRGVPRSKTGYVGVRNGGGAVLHLSFSTNVRTWMSGMSNDGLLTTSNNAVPAGYTSPVLAYAQAPPAMLASPTLVLIQTPVENNQADYQVTRKVTYTCTFSAPHAGLNFV